MNTRDLFVSKLKEHGLWEWFIAKFSKADGSWEHEHGYDYGWRFSDLRPAIWYQQDMLIDPFDYGNTDREFAASSDPDDQFMIGRCLDHSSNTFSSFAISTAY